MANASRGAASWRRARCNSARFRRRTRPLPRTAANPRVFLYSNQGLAVLERKGRHRFQVRGRGWSMCRRRACESSPPPCSTPSMCLGVCPPCCSHPPPACWCTQAVETRGWRKSCWRCSFSAMPSRSAVPCVRACGTSSTSSRASPRCCASGTRAWRWRVSSGRALAEGADGGGGAGTRLPAVLCVTALLPIPLTFSFVHFFASGARGWRCTRPAHVAGTCQPFLPCARAWCFCP